MRTIFITSFDGIETKNVLRTSILETILSRRDLRVVVFTRDKERTEYHRREFKKYPQIIYETVEKIQVRGIDRFFQWLKFVLLKTETTDLRRRLRYGAEGNILRYFGGLAINRLIAGKHVLRAARALDYLLVRNHVYDRFFEKYRPDLVFLANIFYEPEVHFLRGAMRRGVRTIGFINSWDKLTGRCVLRLLADKFVVFNNLVKEELERYNLVESDDIYVGGVPQYDMYFRARPSPRDEFCRRLGLDPKKQIIAYAPIGGAYSDSDWEMIDFLNTAKGEGRFGENTEILVRFHPYDLVPQSELARRPHLKYDYAGVRFSKKVVFDERGDDWDIGDEELRNLRDTMAHMALLVCYASSLSVEAAVCGKPVINVNFELKPKGLTFKSPTQYYKMTHYKKALATGAIRLADSREDLISQVRAYLADPGRDREARERLAKEQCEFLDGNSGERIGKFALSNLL